VPTLLRLDSSADLKASVSRELTAIFADTWRGLGPKHSVVERDLHSPPLPHLADASLHYAPRLRIEGESPDESAIRLQNELLAELHDADAVVIGAPMYNWSIPSTLKAWLDHVHVLGTTVPFDTKDQPLAGKSVVVISSRGAAYDPGTPDAEKDHTLPPIVAVLGTSMGMDVSTVTVQLTLAGRVPAMAPLAQRAQAGLEAAKVRVREFAAQLGS
jgi:FMN-dependent NADH-azoreductase